LNLNDEERKNLETISSSRKAPLREVQRAKILLAYAARTSIKDIASHVVLVAEQLRLYLPGWKSYFRLAQTPKTFRNLDSWIRHRLRAVQLKHWRRGPTIYRGLRNFGAPHELAGFGGGKPLLAS
jgi:hypothetical protein